MLGVHIHAFVYSCSFTVSNVRVMVRIVVSLLMSLKRGTSKNSEKVPYYFLCQQQNICILNYTDISLQILGCECSFSVQHGMLHIWAAEMPHSCISELLVCASAWALVTVQGYPAAPLFSTHFFLHLHRYICILPYCCFRFVLLFGWLVWFFFPSFACFP